jgi:hypothetical protein
VAGEDAARPDDRELDAAAGRVLARLVEASHLLHPDEIGDAIAAVAQPLGVLRAQVYLADLQQRMLTALPGADGAGAAAAPLSIDATLAGWAYRRLRMEQATPGDGRDGYQLWVPLVDGTERLGVLELWVRRADDATLTLGRLLASLAGQIIGAKRSYSDMYPRMERRRPMSLQAELVWGLLPPRTFATDRVLVSAAMEPAYEVGGDAFDYALAGDRLHVSIFDSVGHDLAAGLLASVGMASCRSTRRAGGALPDIVTRADQAIARQFGAERYVTALVCDLSVTTGKLSWIPCGHPPPLLIRGNKIVKQLERTPYPPLGLGDLPRGRPAPGHPAELWGSRSPPVYTEQLEAGDRVLLYTDGVTDGRDTHGTRFGLDRLGDFIIRNSSEGLPAPETLRRLNQEIIDYQQGRLYDDASIVLVEWMPASPRDRLTP